MGHLLRCAQPLSLGFQNAPVEAASTGGREDTTWGLAGRLPLAVGSGSGQHTAVGLVNALIKVENAVALAHALELWWRKAGGFRVGGLSEWVPLVGGQRSCEILARPPAQTAAGEKVWGEGGD